MTEKNEQGRTHFRPPPGAPSIETPSEEHKPEDMLEKGGDDWTVPGLDGPRPEPAEESGPSVGKTVDLGEVASEKSDASENSKESQGCPSCRRLRPEARRFYDASEADKKAWIRYFRGEPRFRRQFELYDGSFLVVLRTQTTQEIDMLYDQLEREMADGTIPRIERYANPKYAYRMSRLGAVLSLEKVTILPAEEGGVPRVLNFPEVTEANFPADGSKTPLLKRAEAEYLRKLPNTAWVTGVQGLLSVFTELCATLDSHMDDPNFYKTAGGPS